MVTTRPSFLILSTLLWFCCCCCPIIRSSRVRATLCETYTSAFQCNATEIEHHVSEEPNCDTDLVATTLDLLDRGDKEIRFTEDGEAIMMIGRTGTGKSTLTYFLAGNNSAMISYKKYENVYYIMDCNGKIGNASTISATIFPDLVIEPTTNTAFYDNPGFMDTRSPCVEIANNYFMMKVANNITKIKVVIAIDHMAMLTTRDLFINSLRSVIEFIPGIENYGPALALVTTKLQALNSSDDTHVADVVKYLIDEAKPTLDQHFADDALRSAHFMVDTLSLEPGHVGIFRMPMDCGPLSDLEFMQNNKLNLHKIILDNLQYANSTPTHFNISISDSAEKSVLELGNDLDVKVIELIRLFATHLYNHLITQLNCSPTNNCDEIMDDLRIVFGNPDFLNGFNNPGDWVGLDFSQIIDRITDPTFIPSGLQMPEDVVESLEKNARYLTFLQDLVNLNIDVAKWLQPLKDMYLNLIGNITVLISNIDSSIVLQFKEFSLPFETDLKGRLDQLVLGLDPDTVVMGETLANLFSSSYSIIDDQPLLDPSEYMVDILNTVRQFSEGRDEDRLAIVKTFGEHLDFLKEVTVDVPNVSINPDDWVEPLKNFRDHLKTYVVSHCGPEMNKTLESLIENFAHILTNFVSPQFDCVDSIVCEELVVSLNKLFLNPDIDLGYIDADWSGSSFSGVVQRINDPTYLPVEIPTEIQTSLKIFGDYLDFLEGLIDLNIGKVPLINEMKIFQNKLHQNITKTETHLHAQLLTFIDTFSQALDSLIQTQGTPCIDGGGGCDDVIFSLRTLFSNTDFLTEYVDNDGQIWPTLTFHEGAVRITNNLFVPEGVTLPTNFYESIKKSSTYLDALNKLKPVAISLTVPALLGPMITLTVKVASVNSRLVPSMDQNIEKIFDALATSLVTDFTNRLNILASGSNTDDLTNLEIDLIYLFESTYPLSSVSPADNQPTEYMTEISSNVENFGKLLAAPDLPVLQKLAEHLNFLKEIKDDGKIVISPKLWIDELTNLNSTVGSHLVTNFIPTIYNNVKNSLNVMSNSLLDTKLIEFGNIKDIFDRETKIKAFVDSVREIRTRIENALNVAGGMSLQDYLVEATNGFIELGIEEDSSVISDVEEKTKFLQFIQELGISTNVTLQQATDDKWLSPFISFYSRLEQERKWTNFLILFIKELAETKVHSDSFGDFKSWFTYNHPVNVTTFRSFWDKFKITNTLAARDVEEYEIIMLIDSVGRLSSLNNLLKITLDVNPACTTTENGNSTFSGNFVSLKNDVIDSSCYVIGTTRTIVVMAYHTVFIDADIQGSHTNPWNNVDILIISPNWWTADKTLIDLTGSRAAPGEEGSGRPGRPGRNAGNLYGVGQTFGPKGIPPTVATVGGAGSDGRAGEGGAEGSPGTRRDVQPSGSAGFFGNSQCDAEIGKVDLKLFVGFYKCDHENGDHNWCTAGDSGAMYTVEGYEGGRGHDGTHGGQPGLGGHGGEVKFLVVGGESPATVVGSDGRTGTKGAGGARGMGGLYGDSAIVYIDDVNNDGGKKCQRRSQEYPTPATKRGEFGELGGEGQDSRPPNSPTDVTYNYSDFDDDIVTFKTTAEGLKGNEFMLAMLTYFLDKL